jgi:hypothetical protein
VGPDSLIALVTMHPAESRPQRLRAWLVGADSAELDYFGVNRSGYRFDRSGKLIRSDWTGTTYRYRVARTAQPPEVEVLAQAWAERDRAGAGLGTMSPRDTARARIGETDIVIDYSRPARRGRIIWGGLVPWGSVWRLGADLATQLQTSTDLRIGTTLVPAGSYTLWMLPGADSAQLIISSATRVWGTFYDPSREFARIRLERHSLPQSVERLTLGVEAGRLWIKWGDAGWSVPVELPRP